MIGKIKGISPLKITLIWLLLLAVTTAAESGKITGQVIDGKNSAPLLGANIILEGTGLGASTDLDGFYTIYNIPPGEYTILISYIGYAKNRINNVTVQPHEVLRLDLSLERTSLQMENIVIEVEAKRSSEAYLITEQKNSNNIQDGISASQISKNGDSDAAEAAKRISGLTVMDGKYVYVRGLGDRYTHTEMNGAPVPSPEPEKRTVPLDLFPAAILENITAKKTYTPDMPGTFGGGNVNIRTKAYPDNRLLKLNFSVSEKTYPTKNQTFLSGPGGQYDFLGYDDGSRGLPAIIPADKKLSEWNSALSTDPLQRKDLLGDIGRAFQTDYTLQSQKVGRPVSAGVSYGNRYITSEYFEWGFFTNTTFSNDYSYKNTAIKEYSMNSSGLDTVIDMRSKKSEYSTNMTATASAGMKLFNRHKLKLHYVYTHRSQNYVNYGRGHAFQFDDGIFIKQYYVEKQISNLTLGGEHQFHLGTNHRLEWNFNYGKSHLDQPDFKGYNYRVKSREVGGEQQTYYQMDTYSWSAGTRIFAQGFDQNQNADISYTTKLQDRFGAGYKFKLGARLQNKTRDFSSRSFYHKYATRFGGSVIPADITVVENKDQFGATLTDINYFQINTDGSVEAGLIVVEDTQPSGAYESGEEITSSYFMLDTPLSFGFLKSLQNVHFIGGMRCEDYQLALDPYQPVSGKSFISPITSDTVISRINERVYLPSYNFLIKLKNDFNIRLSHSRTLARAEFREIAPYEFQAFYGGEILVGYPWLKTTKIKNYDLRLEWFPHAGELLALSLFSKKFKNPIEAALIEASGKVYKTFQNAPRAYSWGVEFDSRYRFDFIPKKYGSSSVMMNFTWTQSEVTLDSMITIFTGYAVENQATSMRRPLQGQSDFIFNLGFNYNSLKGLNATLSYNTFSRRLISLGIATIPNKYEMPYHSLNFTASKKFDKVKLSAKVKNLLNSQVEIGQKDPITDEFKSTKIYQPGMSLSLGISYQL